MRRAELSILRQLQLVHDRKRNSVRLQNLHLAVDRGRCAIEPEHHIVEATAPFFASRFADMPWSVLTPDVCAHWDGHAVSITPGVSQSEAPTADRLEETWRSYYASIFNPARLKVKAMRNEIPKKYWRNLPEASLIKPLIEGAGRTAGAMIANAAK